MRLPSRLVASFFKSRTGWAFLIFFTALGLRLIGIAWGLPNDLRNQSLHPDETVLWLYSRQIEPARLDFDPGFYNYGTLYLTLVRVTTDLVWTYGGGPRDESEASQWRAVGRAILGGRVISALAGATIALAVFLMLTRLTNLFGAVAGGLAAVLAPGSVVHSRFQTVDVLATALLAGGLLLAARLYEEAQAGSEVPSAKKFGPIPWLAIGSGALFGLSAGTKYSGILGLIAVYAVALSLARRDRAWTILSATGAAVLAFLLSTPGVLKNTTQFFKDLSFELQHTATGHGLVFEGTSPGYLYHVGNLFVILGPLLVALGALGWIGLLRRRSAWVVGVLVSAVLYAVLIGRAEVKFARYALPLVPVLCVGFGSLMGWAHEGGRLSRKLLVLVGIVGLAGALNSSATYTLWMTDEDPRDAMARYLRRHASPGERVGVVSDPWFYSVPTFPDSGLPRSVPFPERHARMVRESRPPTVQYLPPDPASRFDWDVRLLRELRPEYVVFSSFEFDDPHRLRGRRDVRTEAQLVASRAEEFRRELERSYKLVRLEGADGPSLHDMMYVRPRVWLWKRKDL